MVICLRIHASPCLTEMFSGSPNDALCEDLPITPTFMEMSLSVIARCILACDLVFFFPFRLFFRPRSSDEIRA